MVLTSVSEITSQHPECRERKDYNARTERVRLGCRGGLTCGLVDGAGLDLLVGGADEHRIEHFGPQHCKTTHNDHQNYHCLSGAQVVFHLGTVVARGTRASQSLSHCTVMS